MKISLIAAVSSNNVIGSENRLPWHLPEDLKNFKKLTMGKPILMGRRTFDSLGRILPGRINIVISRDPNFRPNGCPVFPEISDALKKFADCEEMMVIGGASLFEQMFPLANTLYLTVVEETFEGDTFFPSIDISEWEEHSRQDFIQHTKPYLKYSFREYHKTV